MALGIGLFVRDTAIRFSAQGLDLTRASITGISMNTASSRIGGMGSNFQNPYQIDNGVGGVEDISWVL